MQVKLLDGTRLQNPNSSDGYKSGDMQVNL